MQKIKLISRRLAAPTLHVLQFERPDGFTFKPGQFARLGLPAQSEGADPVIRGYSIASAPENPVLEFFITEVEGGALSPRICALEPGDEVLLDGDAEGALTPSRIPGGDTLWLLATGSGLSPFASIIRSSAVWDAWKDIVLVESVRKIEEAALARELVLSLPADRRPKLIVTTTREEDPARQGDLTGRIPIFSNQEPLKRRPVVKSRPKNPASCSAATPTSSPTPVQRSKPAALCPRASASPASSSSKTSGNWRGVQNATSSASSERCGD